MTAHELARLLLAGPDNPVIGTQPGDEMADYYAATDVEDVTDYPWWDDDRKFLKGPAVKVIYS